MYSEKWINKYGEAYIYDYLKNNGKIILGSHNTDDIKLSIAIENYLVKYRNSSDPIINHFIDSLFETFSDDPLIYTYSYILSNSTIVISIIGNNEKRKKLYEEGKEKLITDWKDTYNKVMNNEPVNTNDKDKMIVLFTFGVRNDIRTYKDQIEKYIFKLLKENKIPDNDLEKLLLFNYASRYTLGYEHRIIDTFIKLGNISNNKDFVGGYEDNGMIVMNDHPSSIPFYQTLDEMIQCVCHETTHAIQEQQAINDPYSVHAMEMAIQKLFAFDEYDTGDNYLFNEIEEDAQRNGYDTASDIYSKAGRQDISDELISKKHDYLKRRRFQYENVTINKNGKKVRISKEKYNVENIRRIIKSNPNLIKRYPVLTNIFDNLGNPKSLDKMLSEDFKSKDIRSMYTDFIINDIRNNELDNINLSNKNDNYKYNVLYNLCNIFRIITDKTLDIIKDYEYRKKFPNKTNFYYRVYIDDVVILGKYIEKELPWMREFEKNNPANLNLYTKYTKSIKDLLNTIDKYKYNNEFNNLEETTNIYKNDLNSLDNNIKLEYINSILEQFSINERSSLLKINNEYMSLEKFIRTKLFNSMTRNHLLYDDEDRLIKDDQGKDYNPVDYARKVLNDYIVIEVNDMYEDNNSNIENHNRRR